jgi:hypothetical protein
MPRDIADLIGSLTSIGGDDVLAHHDRFAADLEALLSVPPETISNRAAWRSAIVHGFAYYYWKWDKRAAGRRAVVERAIEAWSAMAQPDLDIICELLDFHFFLAWCFEGSNTEQSRQAIPAMRTAADCFARDSREPIWPPSAGPTHVIWLAMFAVPDDPMSLALRHVATALSSMPQRFRLSVVAWRQVNSDFLERLEGCGVRNHVPTAATPREMIAAIEAIAASDPPAIAISDMNNAVPTALFARRLAPTQIFLQAGMPAWPVRPLHGVFNSFGFDPARAGWGNARMLPFRSPWEPDKHNPPEDMDELARQRGDLPAALQALPRLIGCYGRLVKVTKPCLRAAERILLRSPDVGFVVGGTGDASVIRAFISGSPVGERMGVIDKFVPGHTWGRLLDLCLDTWPVTGGESCREMMAKGRPVVSMHSEEMPALDSQRDAALLARDWDAFVAIAVGLLNDRDAYASASARAVALVRRMADTQAFASRLADDLDTVLADARKGRARLPRVHAVIRRLLGSGRGA